mgnify:FL=1
MTELCFSRRQLFSEKMILVMKYFLKYPNGQFTGRDISRNLNLNHNELTGTIPESIGNLTKLRTLTLHDNLLTGTIPETIGKLIELDYLHLSNNKLTGSIPKDIEKLTKLRNIYLYNNQLTGIIPANIGNLTKLYSLYLYNNKLTGIIPESIGKLSELRYLYLYDNQIMGLIPQSICNLTLNGISLNNNQLCPSYPVCIAESSIGTQDTTRCGYPQIFELIPNQPATGQMVTLGGINFGSPSNLNTVKFDQNEISVEGFIFQSPSTQTELFVRIPTELSIGICTTTVSVSGESTMASYPFTFTLNSVPGAPVLRNVFKDSSGSWVKADIITGGDTVLISGHGIGTGGWTVSFSKDGKTFMGKYVTTYSSSELRVAPAVVVPSGMGSGFVEITASVTVAPSGTSGPSSPLQIYFKDNQVYVDINNTAGPWKGTEASPFNKIQAGIDATNDTLITRGRVLVSPGTYKENIIFNGKSINVGSLYTTTGDTAYISSTIIDGNNNGSVVSFVNNEDSTVVLTGFTIQNGSGTLINATQSHGGGIYCKGASPLLKNLIIKNNTATTWGGGINCSFSAHPIISNVIIQGNKTIDSNSGQGGGLYCWYSAPVLTNVLITKNSAVYGGGVYLGQQGSGAKLTNVTIADNIGSYGGGIYLNLANGELTNKPMIINTIIWNNLPKQIYFSSENNSWEMDISFSDIQGGKDSIVTNDNATINWTEGNIDLEPLLHSDYRLDEYSPVIGAGTSTGAPLTDLDGNPRPNPEGSNPDMGAYESSRAKRLLYTAPIMDGLDSTDISFWNDASTLSGHWQKFEDNSNVTYQYAIGTYQANNIVDWQTSGTDTFVTVTGLNLKNDSTYHFSVIGTDQAGSVSKIASSDGVKIDIIPPAIISSEKVWTSSNPIIGNLKLKLKFSEPIFSGSVKLESLQGDQYNNEYKIMDQNQFDITIFGPFTGGDDISVTVENVKDRAGSIARDSIFTYPVAYLSDYNSDGLIDALDLSKLVMAWYSKDLQFELAPTSGDMPYLKPVVDNQFDIYDAAAFTRMWHWSLNKSGKIDARYYTNSGKELMFLIENSTLGIQVAKEVNAVDFYFDYPKEYLEIKSNDESSTPKEMMLSHIDTLNGEYYLIAGYVEQKMRSIDIPYNIKGEDDVTITAVYRMFDVAGELISQGTKEILLKPLPEEFALHQNYPNPFNPFTTIKFDVPEQTHINLIIYDVLGREVVKLLNQEVSAGYQSIVWNTRNNFDRPVSAGVYFYQIQAKDFIKTRKMVLLK